jgi:RNA polymerase sigma-70 factor, ECF subfamily
MRPNSSVGDRRLYRRLVARELDALGDVYDRDIPVVYGVAVTVTAERGASDVVTQEVFVDLWRQRERFHSSRVPGRPWLATLAHRRAVETVRDSKHRAGTRPRWTVEPLQRPRPWLPRAVREIV